jgi:hypothetical protein
MLRQEKQWIDKHGEAICRRPWPDVGLSRHKRKTEDMLNQVVQAYIVTSVLKKVR